MWKLPTKQITALTAHTLGGDIWSQGTTDPEEYKSTPLHNKGNKLIQGIIEALLYYSIAVDNKLLVSLSANGAQQAAITERTNEAINQVLKYSSTYPANGVLYCSSDIVLYAHSDAGFHN